MIRDERAHRVLLLLVRAPTIGKRLHDSYFMIDMYYVSNPPTFEFPKRRALWLLEITAEKLLSVQGLTRWSIGRNEPAHRVLLLLVRVPSSYSTSLLLVRARVSRGSRLVRDDPAHRVLLLQVRVPSSYSTSLLLVRAPTIGKKTA